MAVFTWACLNLFRVVPVEQYRRLTNLASLSPEMLNRQVRTTVESSPGWEKMNSFEREQAVKGAYEEVQYANNIQLLARLKHYAILTNLILGLDLKGGSQLLLQALPSPLVPEITPEVMRGVEAVINNRINTLGVSETVVQRAGRDRLIVELPGVKDPEQAKARIGDMALLEFKELAIDPSGAPIWKDVGLTGADFKHAQAMPIAGGNTWRITFEFKPVGAKTFGKLTSRLVGQQIGIFLDGEPTER